MDPDSTVPRNIAPQGARALSTAILACVQCGTVLWQARRGQKYCSGKCRAAASRTSQRSRIERDLLEVQRRIERVLRDIGK